MTAAAPATPCLPGRLGDPARALKDDPRADPRMVAALAPFGLDGDQPVPPVSPSSSRRELLTFAQGAEDGFSAVFTALFADLRPLGGVERTTVGIPGPDGNDVVLFVHRPEGAGVTLPAVVHFHGGGGVILRAADSFYVRWRDELALSGLVVVGVEFRNAAAALGVHPYPAGLNDCAAAVRWTAARRADLGVGAIVVSGESGGGNLALAVALKAKREGWVDEIDGVYALAPMISGRWDKPPELPSQQENDGYFISCALLSIMGALYDPDGAHSEEYTCWPSRASDGELAGLPPHVISVNELDPLRDEGLAHLRRLVANGVSAVGRTVNGTVHTGDVFFRAAVPEAYASTIRDIQGFAAQLRAAGGRTEQARSW
jgi:acetyl esterase/lipase